MRTSIILFFSFCLSLFTDGQSTLNLYVDKIQYIEDTIPVGTKPFIILSNNWEINYDRTIKYLIESDTTFEFDIQVISEIEEIGISLLSDSGKVLKVGNRNQNRLYRKTISYNLQKNKTYRIVIGSRTDKIPIPYKLVINRKGIDARWRIEKYEKLNIEDIRSYTIDSSSSQFEGNYAKIFELNLSEVGDQAYWIRIKCSSKVFKPVILVLDNKDYVFEADDYKEYYNESPEILINPKVDSVKFIVISSSDKFQFKDKPSYSFKISTEKFLYNPNASIIEKIWYFITSINSLIASTIIAFLIGYLFYKASINARKICHWEISDTRVISKGDGINHKVVVNNRSVDCASQLKYTFKNIGRKRIKQDQIIEPIILEYSNVDEILDLDFQHEGDNWEVPEIIPPKKVLVNFKYIDKGDQLTISSICSLSSEEQKNNGIIPKVTGKISEGQFFEKVNRPQSVLLLLVISLSYFSLFIIIPLSFAVILLDINMPPLYYSFNTIFWPIAIVILYFHLFTTGRKYFLDAPKAINQLVSRIFKTSANRVYGSAKVN